MIIKNISCGQFAGIRDRSIDLDDGINVIYGKNESGKSTLVNLLSRTLFQNAKLDGRKDKEFIGNYFPSAKKGGISGDFVDGEVTFETEKGSYTLSKEWGTEARCSLSTPDGKIRDQKKITAILSEVLGYEEGVYGELLLSSQSGSNHALESLLDASNNKMAAKKELTDIVTRAFAESDGISMDAIGLAIEEKIVQIAGKHWDADREMPTRCKAERWVNGLGEILEAYYALEDAKKVNESVSGLEKDVDETAEAYRSNDKNAKHAEAELENFRAFANELILRSERQKEISHLTEAKRKYETALDNWPVVDQNLEKAKLLKAEKDSRAVLDLYQKVKGMAEELSDQEALLESTPCPTKAEITAAKNAQNHIDRLRNKLCGMNLAATIKMLGSHSVEIRSVRTGELLDVAGENCSITESVSIQIPGVMEMLLAPANVDVDALEEEIHEFRVRVNEIFEKYKIASIDELETLAERCRQRKSDADNQRMRMNAVLGNLSLETLEKAAQTADVNAREMSAIDADIHQLCGSVEISRFISGKEVALEHYENEHISINALEAKLNDTIQKLQSAQSSIITDEDIPDAYRMIADPEQHLSELQEKAADAQNKRQTAYGDKTAAAQKLETYKEGLNGDPVENEEKARRIFEEKKELLNHWLHIQQVFLAQKEALSANPMQDLSDRFAHYLSVISGGRVASEFPELDKLNMCIYSDNRLVDYGKLSEGTKDTVSLAFRLATLDHLFPNGGGVIVFDDPFTDMDAERTEQACALVRECAQRHQVVFLTCKEEYLDMLCGKIIRVGE